MTLLSSLDFVAVLFSQILWLGRTGTFDHFRLQIPLLILDLSQYSENRNSWLWQSQMHPCNEYIDKAPDQRSLFWILEKSSSCFLFSLFRKLLFGPVRSIRAIGYQARGLHLRKLNFFMPDWGKLLVENSIKTKLQWFLQEK